MQVNTTRILNFTSLYDKDGDDMTLNVTMRDRSALKDFMKFEGLFLVLQPTLAEDIGIYVLIATVTDINFNPAQRESSYEFKITVIPREDSDDSTGGVKEFNSDFEGVST